MSSGSSGRTIVVLDVLRSLLIDTLAFLNRDIGDVAGSIEQDINFLQGKSFGFWYKEVHECDREGQE